MGDISVDAKVNMDTIILLSIGLALAGTFIVLAATLAKKIK